MRHLPKAALALLALSLGAPAHAAAAKPAKTPKPARAAAPAPPPESVTRMADWITATGDPGGRPFVIIDKVAARVFVYRPDGQLRGQAPALLGAAKGDNATPGVGDREMSDIRPNERTTPAGRFVARPGRNAAGEDVVWIDYDAAVSLHRVRTKKAAERRLERLASPTAADNRISYGCVNVPAAFYDTVVAAALRGPAPIIYVLPEVRSMSDVFGKRDRRIATGRSPRHPAS